MRQSWSGLPAGKSKKARQGKATESIVYKRLDTTQRQTRILELHPGSGDEPIRATLLIQPVPHRPTRHCPEDDTYRWERTGNVPMSGRISDHPRKGQSATQTHDNPRQEVVPYEAVSYCWLDPNDKTGIVVNDEPLQIPTSAYRVIQRFREPKTKRFLWIDAVCINQADFRERGYQVTMMGDIYANATQTLVWLGEEDDRTGLALEMCHTINTIAAPHRHSGQEAFESRLTDIPIPEGFDISVLDTIFDRRWFRRMWIFQEMLLSRDRVCHIGKHTFEWNVALTAGAWYHKKLVADSQIRRKLRSRTDLSFYSGVQLCNSLLSQEDYLSGTEFRPPLHTLLTLTKYLEASDSRDKIYALLSMTRWSETRRTLPEGL